MCCTLSYSYTSGGYNQTGHISWESGFWFASGYLHHRNAIASLSLNWRIPTVSLYCSTTLFSTLRLIVVKWDVLLKWSLQVHLERSSITTDSFSNSSFFILINDRKTLSARERDIMTSLSSHNHELYRGIILLFVAAAVESFKKFYRNCLQQRQKFLFKTLGFLERSLSPV